MTNENEFYILGECEECEQHKMLNIFGLCIGCEESEQAYYKQENEQYQDMYGRD